MKKFFLFVFIAFITSNNAFAVLDEKNLGSTLAVLRQELEMNHNDTRRSMIMSKELRENMQSRVMQIMSESNQIALMLYSQKMDYIFDLSDEDLGEMHVFAKHVALAIQKAFPCRKVGEAVIGLEVPHAHIHLIPMQKESDMLFSNPKLKLQPEDFEAIAKAIRENL